MRKTLICFLLLAGCGGERSDDPSTEPSTPDGTGPPGGLPDRPPGWDPAGTMEVSCQVTDNVLRYSCHVTVDPPSPVTMTIRKASGGTARVFESAEVAAEHDLTLWLMAPRTEYVWTAEATDLGVFHAGTYTTDAVPDSVRVEFAIEGEASFPYFAAASPCGGGASVLIASTEGEVLWYHEFADPSSPFSFVDSMSFTEDGTILVIVDTNIIEIDLLGNELMRLERFVDYDEVVHHDLFRKDGNTWVLHKDDVVHLGETYTLDGFYVFDSTGALIADWRLYDHFQPTAPPDGFFGSDYSHANSLWVDDGGDVFLSMRHLSAIAHIEGDLTSPDFGNILWRMSGNPDDTDFGSDFVLTAPPGISASFVQQHNVHLLPDGLMTLFDNREEFFENSRLLHISYDETLGEAFVEEAYELPLHCDFQGGAWHTAGGNPVATCAPIAQGFEFELGVTDLPRWTADMDCFSGIGVYVPRFVPLEESDL